MAHSPPYPASRIEGIKETRFGVEIHDPYRWLENTASTEVQDWVRQQNQYADSYFRGLGFYQDLATKLKTLSDVTYVDHPRARPNGTFRYILPRGKNKFVLRLRVQGLPFEKIIFDANSISSRDGTQSVVISNDGQYLAYTVAQNNSDEATLYVRKIDFGLGPLNTDTLHGLKFSEFVLSPDSRGLYYNYYPQGHDLSEQQRLSEAHVRYHEFNTDQDKDIVVFDKNFMYPKFSSNSKWVLASTWVFENGQYVQKVFAKDTKKENSAFQFIDLLPVVYDLNADDSHIYFMFNDASTPNSLLMRLSELKLNAGFAAAEIVAPHRENAVLVAYRLWANQIFLEYREKGSSRIYVANPNGSNRREIHLPLNEFATVPDALLNSRVGYFTSSSMISPPKIYKLSAPDFVPTLYQSNRLPFDSADYIQEKLSYISNGRDLTMHLARRKNKINTKIPIIIHVYGGFGESITPTFDPRIVPWLEAGGGYAIINVSGDGERGELMHKAGRLFNKKATFEDVISAACFLIANGYSTAKQLGLYGSSNGGLTVGAVINSRPDLFGAAALEVPLLDLIRYPLFGAVARTWIWEYGDPNQEEDFRNLLSFSPYHWVKKDTGYPAMLLIAASNDDRVYPLHAYKMAAALQAATTSEQPILLRTQHSAGHGGPANLSAKLENAAEIFSFFMHNLGLRNSSR